MEILQVNKLYYPDVGGIESVVRMIAEYLVDTEHNPVVLAAKKRGRGGRTTVNGVPVRKVSSAGIVQSVPVAPTFPIRFTSQSKTADIVHHHLPNPLSSVAQLAAGTCDAGLIATYHSDIVRQAAALRFYRPVLERFLDRVDRILVTSERLLAHSNVLAPYEAKCEIIPLSVDIDAIDTESPEPLDIDTTGPIISFVGRLNYYKGVEYLIDAMANIDAKLIIAGDGKYRSALEQRVSDHGVEDRVQFLGYVSESQLPSVYRSSDVFVLPSIEPSEAFGIVQLEAMARGIPVVNTSLPTGVPWVSQDGNTGITVAPRDASALGDAITTLLDDDDRRRQYGSNARSRVERLFTRDQMLESIQKVYESVACGG